MIHITDDLFIDESELTFSATRSSGPGGQHVNKVSTRITLWFDVGQSGSLNPDQKERILSRLKTRITKNQRLHIVSQRHRSQLANKEAAIERFVELMADALTDAPMRKKPASAARPDRNAWMTKNIKP
ncbi:MAG: aminoacyl-tRNA hydrolase [Desulfobacterales bacterium CG23_combo_of_CG06-09_8_20_14_all_51_8]|nr:MAG: aminoacyl-tRNA hydrolase [Desulfobacterales bacterium CG23_combo_of_CG06-09_8_20_14_all_51_8]